MAHVIHENNYNVGSTNNNENTSNNNEKDAINVRSLRDVNNFLQQPLKPALNLQADAASYDHIVDMIRGLDIQDDGIEMNRKIKSIEIDFCNIVHDEHILCESMEYMNDKALGDADSALKFAMLFSSHSFDALAMHEMKVRSAMLKILETNYINATIYRTQDKNRLYNSITMLGEYYHRVRLADNMPVSILGESLLRLLNNELKEAQPVELGLAKLLLSQITLNGRLLRSRCEAQLSELFYHLRRQLIEQTSLTCTVKALLLMTLDMYYSDFNNLSTDLEDMYTKYFLQGEQEEDNAQKPTANPPTVNPPVREAPTPKANGLDQRVVDEPSSPPIMTSTKKWSEQITEDSYENEFDTWSSLNNNNNNNNLITAKVDEPQEVSRPAFKKSSPKKLQQQQPQQQANNEDDHNKPMPRWRAPRFNRETSDNRTVQHHQKNDGYVHNKHRSGNRRLSGNFDDDQQSVRSEGGSIRLYSINDRLKHSQEKIDRINPTVGGGGSGGNHNYYNSSSIANSNWDRQSSYNRDDRSERSYISNYERGSHGQQNQQQHRRNGNGSRHFNNNNHHHHNNNKQTYDKPPRFLKQQQQQQQKQTESSGDTSTWRKNWKQRDNGESDDFDNQSRSSSRARTLPRPHKSPLDDQPPVTTATFQQRRNSQSPSGRGPFAANSRQHNYRNNYNHHNNSNYHNRRQYGSQNSLASDASAGGGFIDRRQQHHRRSRQFNHHHDNNVDIKNHNNNKNSNNGVNDGVKGDKDWHESNNNGSGPQSLVDVDGELVRNARKTANYMNYLSQQK